jgi:putative FmdB family regulatory protein
LPTYEYVCTACGHRLDAVQKFTDDPLTECPECGGALRKVFGAVGIVLKGSGFYKTDTRAQAGSNGSGTSKPEPKAATTTESGSGDSAKTTSDKPAKESSPAASSAG